MVWMDRKEGDDDEQVGSWAQNNNSTNGNTGGLEGKGGGMEMSGLPTFKSLLDGEDVGWYLPSHHSLAAAMQSHGGDISFGTNFGEADQNNGLFLHPVESSSSCSPSSAPALNSLDSSQVHYFLAPKTSSIPSMLNPLESGGFDLGCENGFLENHALSAALSRGGGILSGGFGEFSSQNPNLSSVGHQFGSTNLLQLPQNGGGGFGPLGFGEGCNDNVLFLNRSKLLKPLDNFASIGAQPTLFQKRAALRKNLANSSGNLEVLGGVGGITRTLSNVESCDNKVEMSEMIDVKRKENNGDEVEDVSKDRSNLNYDSDELLQNNSNFEESIKTGGGMSSNTNSTLTGGDQKGKKKGLPAKNLMAERRRRKKLNDRLYMLRSVVPKISKVKTFFSSKLPGISI